MNILFEQAPDGIVTLTLDRAGHSANVLDAAFMAELSEAIDRTSAETTITGLIITSAKATWLAGADLDTLLTSSDPQTYIEMTLATKAIFRRLETIGKPVVAALNGSALGGGLELALACHQRIAIDDPRLKIGLPEVTLGLLPAAGGVVRCVRLMGIQKAVQFMAQGKPLTPQAALSAEIIHQLASDESDLLAKARAWIAANPAPKAPWDQPRFKIPGGDPSHPAVAQMLAIAPAMMRKETRGNYLAPHAILAAAAEGAQVTFATAEIIESRYFARLAAGQQAHNMINAFWFNLNAIKKGHNRPADIPFQPSQKVGVLGAGMMGHGIAYSSAMAGMDVVMIDATQSRADAGKANIGAILDKRVARGKLSQTKATTILDQVTATADYADLAGCDLVIEAVFENRELKAQVTARAEAEMATDGVFASNTSTLPITGLARASVRPEQFIGLHFFSPVHKMKLVEIIVGEQTNAKTLAKAFDYVLAIKKLPIVVNDRRGFYTSRVFSTWVNEGLALLGDGQHPQAIEMAGLQAGMPVGPLAVLDEVSIGLVDHIRQQTAADLAAAGQPIPAHPANGVIDVMVAQKRLGRAAGAGFYDYDSAGKRLWPGLEPLFMQGQPQLDQQDMVDRLLMIQAIETVRCVEEGVVQTSAEANIGSIFGWGFAPFHGGTLQYINAMGLPAFIARAEQFAEQAGSRFAPPPLLLEMAASGKTF